MNQATALVSRAARARPSWLESLARSQPALAEWATALQAAIAAGPADADLGRIVGKGLLIATREQVNVEDALEEIARSLGIAIVRIDASGLDDFLVNREPVEAVTLVHLAFDISVLSNDNTEPASIRVRHRLAAILDDPRDRRVFVVCARRYQALAASLRRAGRFDACLGWEDPTPESSVEEFFAACAGVRIATEVTRDLDRLGRLLCVRFPGRRRLGLLGIAMRRLSQRTGRAISMHDLMNFAADGTQLRPRPRELRDERQIAIHEAGHALVYLIANDWARFPDFVSITSGRDYLGLMMENACQTHRTEHQISVREVCIRLKTMLAGRAAEHCILGVEEVSAFGATEDLAEARSLAVRLVAEAGVTLEGGRIQQRPWACVSEPGERETSDIARAAQALTEHCWNDVIAMLDTHRALLLHLSDALIEHRCLIASDIRSIVEAFGAGQARAA